MSAYSNNLWAEELAIDLGELERERPTHPDQLRLARKISKRADEYWARERFLARLKTHIPEHVYTPPVVETVVPKATKVGRYEFTDRQLEIAGQVLDAHDKVREVRV